MPNSKMNWMPKPLLFTDCPPGLEYLSVVDHLFIHKIIEERRSGIIKYWVKNKNGQTIYRAENEDDMRECCSIIAPDIEITNNLGREVIHLYRRSTSCFEEITMEVYAPVGEIIGYVRQSGTCECIQSYFIQNASGENCYRLKTVVCSGGCCNSDDTAFELKLMSLDDELEVGRLRKQWAGFFAKEFFKSPDDYGISFPMDLDVRMKAVMLGACFLISYLVRVN